MTRSPCPGEADVLVLVHFVSHGVDLTFRACETAARRFAVVWSAHHHPDFVTIVNLSTSEASRMAHIARLTCERLWIVP